MITTDGDLYSGVLESYDHTANICIKHAVKRIITQDENIESYEEHVGLFVIRGDCVTVIGLVEPLIDSQYDWTEVRGEKLKRYR